MTAGGTDPRRRCATTQCDHAAMALNTVAHDMRMHSSYCVQYDNDSIWQQSIVYHQNQELNDHFIPCSICRGNKICILTEAQRYTYSYYSIYTIPECKNAFLQLRGLQNQNSQCTRKFWVLCDNYTDQNLVTTKVHYFYYHAASSVIRHTNTWKVRTTSSLVSWNCQLVATWLVNVINDSTTEYAT